MDRIGSNLIFEIRRQCDSQRARSKRLNRMIFFFLQNRSNPIHEHKCKDILMDYWSYFPSSILSWMNQTKQSNGAKKSGAKNKWMKLEGEETQYYYLYVVSSTSREGEKTLQRLDPLCDAWRILLQWRQGRHQSTSYSASFFPSSSSWS